MTETNSDLAAAASGTGLVAPPVVYVPVTLDDQGVVADITMLKLGDGRVALLAYTALDRLVDACGDDQAWVLVMSADVPRLEETKHFDLKLLDAELPEEIRAALPRSAVGAS